MLTERRWLQIHDYLTFKPLAVEDGKRYLWECKDSQTETGHSLLVTVKATHAGIVTGNRKFYRPDFMQASTHSWVPSGLPALPVLRGHDKEGDVLGRVREAKYIDDSWRWAAKYPFLKQSVLYNQDASNKRPTVFQTVRSIEDTLLKVKDYQGLGWIQLGLTLTDPKAIQRVLRDEYLCVSAGALTDQAICSICHTDWASDDKCDHTQGEIVDGRQMFLINGRFKYKELSFVNFGADPFAHVTAKELNDSLEKMFFLGLPLDDQKQVIDRGLTIADSLYGSDIAPHYEDPTMSFDVAAARQTIKDAELTSERAFQIQKDLEAWDAVSDSEKEDRKSLKISLMATIRRNNWKEAESTTEVSDAEVASVPAVEDASVAAAVLEAEAVPAVVEDKVAGEAEAKNEKAVKTQLAISDELKEAIKSIEIHDAAANCETCAKVLSGTAKAEALYASADDNHKSKIRYVGRALLEKFSAADQLDWAKQYLQNHDSDSVFVSKTEVADKDNLVLGLESDLKAVKDSIGAKDKTVAKLLNDSKRSLATTIVMQGVMSQKPGFSNLTPAQIEDKVVEYTKRHIQSLRDAVNDIFTELQWVKPAAAEPAVASVASGTLVNDNAHVDETEVTRTPQEIKDQQVQDTKLLWKHLNYIHDPAERARFEADVKFGRVKLSK